MRRIALLGIMSALFISSAAMANENHQDGIAPGTYKIDCRFRGDVKGFDHCRAFAVINVRPEAPATYNHDDDQMQRHNRLAVICNDVTIYEDGARVREHHDMVKIQGIPGPLPELVLSERALKPTRHDHEDDMTSTAWLNLVEGQFRGFCDVRFRPIFTGN